MTLISPERKTPLPHVVVVIRGDRIAAIGSDLVAGPHAKQAHGFWHWPGDLLSATPPREARDVIRAAAQAHVGVQPTLQAVYGDLSIFDTSLLDDPRLGKALPRMVIDYLKSDAGKAAHRAVADEYRQAITKLLGKDVDPAKAMSVGPVRAPATPRTMLAENVKLLFGTDRRSNEGSVIRPV